MILMILIRLYGLLSRMHGWVYTGHPDKMHGQSQFVIHWQKTSQRQLEIPLPDTELSSSSCTMDTKIRLPAKPSGIRDELVI